MKRISSKIFVVVITILLLLLQSSYIYAGANKLPQKTKITKVTVDNGKAIIQWKRVKNVDGYSVYMSKSKNGKYTKIKNIYGNKTVKYTKKGLDNSKEYYFKVKTFIIKNNKKIYSSSSNKKSGGGLLASKMLTSSSNSSNRNVNLAIASNRINGIILKPGQKFKWSQIVGILSEAQGYRKAIAYVNGNNVLSIGGGVCQVSTTLYQCAKNTRMKIIERHEHGKAVTYIESGEDATVTYGLRDFIFKNNKPYAIKIVAGAYQNSTICQFYKIGD